MVDVSIQDWCDILNGAAEHFDCLEPDSNDNYFPIKKNGIDEHGPEMMLYLLHFMCASSIANEEANHLKLKWHASINDEDDGKWLRVYTRNGQLEMPSSYIINSFVIDKNDSLYEFIEQEKDRKFNQYYTIFAENINQGRFFCLPIYKFIKQKMPSVLQANLWKDHPEAELDDYLRGHFSEVEEFHQKIGVPETLTDTVRI